jgi:hypothetical protein
MDLPSIQATLERAGVLFERGLDTHEIDDVEQRYGFRFPPDLRRFLMHALPVSRPWVNWRSDNEAQIRDRLDWPSEGLCFDVENDAFWLDEWGMRPAQLEDAFAIARKAVAAAPKLIPICSHRYLPERPFEEGNPVFSVHQTDVIYYGTSLQNYLENEFSYYFGTEGYVIRGPVKRIEFWTSLVEGAE